MRAFDAAYFAASCDSPEENARFAKDLELDYPILSDPSKQVAKAYGALNPKNELPFRWTFYIGKDGKLLYVDKDVKPDSHGKDVAAKLAELGVAKKKK